MSTNNDVILWQEDDALTPDAERIHAAYERIVNDMSRFSFLPDGRLERSLTLAKDMEKAKHVAGGGDEPYTEYDLPNGLSVTFSGERCSKIFVRRNSASLAAVTAERDALDARCRELEGALGKLSRAAEMLESSRHSSTNEWDEVNVVELDELRDDQKKAAALLTPATPAAKPEDAIASMQSTLTPKRRWNPTPPMEGIVSSAQPTAKLETTETPVVATDAPEHISVSVSGSLYSVPRAVADCIYESRKAMVLAATEIKEWRTSWRLTNFELVAARKGTDENPTLAEMLKERPSRMWGVIRAEHEAKQTTETPAFTPRRFVEKGEQGWYWQTEPDGKVGIYETAKRFGDSVSSLEMLTDPNSDFREVPIPDETPAPTCGTCDDTKIMVDCGRAYPCPDCATAEGGVA